jgi:hypothetical protein
LDKDEYELVLQQLQLNIPIAAIQALLEKRTDMDYSYDQLTAIRTKAAHTLVLGDISFPAERLMRKLEADPDIYYVIYTAHHSMGNLITFRVSKKDILGMSQTEVGDVGPDDNNRASTFAESVMKGLSLQGGATLLLAAAWVKSEGRLYYDMFGEAVGFDITCGTNAEKRPLARSRDSDYCQ